MVSKFNPIRLGRRKVFLVESHVPSPTVKVLELYVLLPGGERVSGEGAITAMKLPKGSGASFDYNATTTTTPEYGEAEECDASTASESWRAGGMWREMPDVEAFQRCMYGVRFDRGRGLLTSQ
jgi:hypothetical protein